MKSDLIDIAGKVVHETEKAILFNDGTRKVWLPRSRCEIEELPDGTVVLTLTEALAQEKELI